MNASKCTHYSCKQNLSVVKGSKLNQTNKNECAHITSHCTKSRQDIQDTGNLSHNPSSHTVYGMNDCNNNKEARSCWQLSRHATSTTATVIVIKKTYDQLMTKQ